MLLTQDQINELTGRTKFSAQRRALRQMGIPFYERPDGKPMVVEAALTGQPQKAPQPDFEAI